MSGEIIGEVDIFVQIDVNSSMRCNVKIVRTNPPCFVKWFVDESLIRVDEGRERLMGY